MYHQRAAGRDYIIPPPSREYARCGAVVLFVIIGLRCGGVQTQTSLPIIIGRRARSSQALDSAIAVLLPVSPQNNNSAHIYTSICSHESERDAENRSRKVKSKIYIKFLDLLIYFWKLILYLTCSKCRRQTCNNF